MLVSCICLYVHVVYRVEWSFSSVDYLGNPSFVKNLSLPTNGTFYRGQPFPTAFLTSTPASYQRYDDNGMKFGVLQEFESSSAGSQLNASTFGIVLSLRIIWSFLNINCMSMCL
jgi:hypothetical protein